MMVEFTNSELLMIANWAMDKADAARSCRFVNTYLYETAKEIFHKAHEEYMNREKQGQS